ncbi:MAG: HPF/RaiA family ribosome-associated protein [Gammaproteobacteria bacterium]|nr:HPF/RaiA family ribosome-associated protein [Gammaproteobacteria bacterium]MBU0785591.1 HPF/RaiA family ribosome-associated protein [Gammaproteobacteria bacterium]MBU0816880.1 HPF/RaiA family ribosome-associated protein [Gammaproteobacteria bacterium]MBU1787044.1 HPF/RaiA family ribosome-associated protein [Gammaproteobacteria bacterium]
MQIQVNTSNGIENKETLERWAASEMQSVLSHFKDDITRVEIHLSNESASKAGGDNRCTMEARLVHHQPVATSHHAPTQDAAFRGASDKLKHALDKTLGRLRNHRDHDSIRKIDGAADE